MSIGRGPTRLCGFLLVFLFTTRWSLSTNKTIDIFVRERRPIFWIDLCRLGGSHRRFGDSSLE
jgi:hypothetical protein